MLLIKKTYKIISTIKKVIFILHFLVFGFLFLCSSGLYGENQGFKYSRNYSYKEYDHQNQNWAIAQDSSGILFVANVAGVLEYDGSTWRVYYDPPDKVRSLAVDNSGAVFIGGNNEIGCLEPDSTGMLIYRSLVDRLKNDKQMNIKNFGWVWSVHATRSGIYFRTSGFIFRWDGKQLEPISTGNKLKASFVYNGELVVRDEKRGLLKVVKNSIEQLPGGQAFAGKKIYMMVPYDNDPEARTFLAGTRYEGFFLYNEKTVEPFPIGKEIENYLKKNRLNHGIRLDSGEFAIATKGGLLFMDRKGQLKKILNKSSGLQDDDIQQVYQDVYGNIWLSLSNGISKIEYESPISVYDDRSDLPGLVISVVKHRDSLFVGTSKGLYFRESSSVFTPVPGISSYCWSLVSSGDSIIAATDEGVFQVKNNYAESVIKDRTFVLLISKYHPGHIWCGTTQQLILLTFKDGSWLETYRLNTAGNAIFSIAENNKGQLWLGTLDAPVFNITFPNGISQPVLVPYDTSHGLPEKEIFVAQAAGHTIFATAKGLFRFDAKKELFIPDQVLGAEFAGGTKARAVFRIVEDQQKHVWFNSESSNFQAIPQADGSFKIYSRPLRRIPLVQVNNIYPDPDGKTAWFASNEGLIRYDRKTKKNYRHYFKTLIRKVIINEKQENQRDLYNGRKKKIKKTNGLVYQILGYDDRNLLFEFAAPFFEMEERTQYQYLLQGYDKKWSIWNKDSKKYYTNLNPGRYSFRVRARNIFLHQGEEDVFRFRILPPWYLTWWAFLFYGVFLLSMMFLVVKWRSYRLVLQTRKLEQTVKERTTEIHEKNVQLKYQSEKLKEMDKVKSRFFANLSHAFRTPLMLIMSPLEQMIGKSRDNSQKKELKMMLRNSQWLLTLINQLLDLARFDNKEEKLHAACQNIIPFLKNALEPFQVLARQNKLNLEFHSLEKEIDVYFEPRKIEEVISNLLINAIKFTPPGGKIIVTVSREKQESSEKEPESFEFVKISVRDTGTGISRKQLTHIFDRFYQAGGMKENLHKGTGIGLAIANEIIKLHHGIIDVHSGEGKGTEFVVKLPFGNKHLKPEEVVLRSDLPEGNSKAKEIETIYMRPEEETGEMIENGSGEETPKENRAPDKNVILVVEDIADVRNYIRGPLVEAGYAVVEAADGKEGLEKAEKIIPDLVVSDIMMPHMDGYELCRALKNDINTSHIPVILLTAKASEESVVKGLETGADDYVTKPFNAGMLLNRIKNLIELRRQLQLKIQRQKMLLPVEVPVSSMDDKFLKELQEIIEKNLSDPEFKIEELYKKLYIGRTTLFRKVEALTGETPNEFIKSYRLERAAQLLKKNFGNITEVAFEVGFINPQYFSQCFKEKFHQSPSSFKASESN